MDYILYPTELTEEEKKLGFEITDVENPEGKFTIGPTTVKAVVNRIGPSDRVIKMQSPDGKIIDYQCERYGQFKGQEDRFPPDWLTTGLQYNNPDRAVSIAKSRKDAPLNNIITKIPPDSES